jgi:hypothetical protein
MKHEFIILVKGKLKTYTNWEDIPEKFDNVIKFNPYMPPPPHTEKEHDEIESWMPRFKELMSRETK